ncbi:MAG: hypothetical protein LBQ54_09930 [Planctomycetaceae bacterium]|jgi:hypothetical protein|nr:hypothetical protein [Planctomycetaceae bacterium]
MTGMTDITRHGNNKKDRMIADVDVKDDALVDFCNQDGVLIDDTDDFDTYHRGPNFASKMLKAGMMICLFPLLLIFRGISSLKYLPQFLQKGKSLSGLFQYCVLLFKKIPTGTVFLLRYTGISRGIGKFQTWRAARQEKARLCGEEKTHLQKGNFIPLSQAVASQNAADTVEFSNAVNMENSTNGAKQPQQGKFQVSAQKSIPKPVTDKPTLKPAAQTDDHNTDIDDPFAESSQWSMKKRLVFIMACSLLLCVGYMGVKSLMRHSKTDVPSEIAAKVPDKADEKIAQTSQSALPNNSQEIDNPPKDGFAPLPLPGRNDVTGSFTPQIPPAPIPPTGMADIALPPAFPFDTQNSTNFYGSSGNSVSENREPEMLSSVVSIPGTEMPEVPVAVPVEIAPAAPISASASAPAANIPDSSLARLHSQELPVLPVTSPQPVLLTHDTSETPISSPPTHITPSQNFAGEPPLSVPDDPPLLAAADSSPSRRVRSRVHSDETVSTHLFAGVSNTDSNHVTQNISVVSESSPPSPPRPAAALTASPVTEPYANQTPYTPALTQEQPILVPQDSPLFTETTPSSSRRQRRVAPSEKAVSSEELFTDSPRRSPSPEQPMNVIPPTEPIMPPAWNVSVPQDHSLLVSARTPSLQNSQSLQETQTLRQPATEITDFMEEPPSAAHRNGRMANSNSLGTGIQDIPLVSPAEEQEGPIISPTRITSMSVSSDSETPAASYRVHDRSMNKERVAQIREKLRTIQASYTVGDSQPMLQSVAMNRNITVDSEKYRTYVVQEGDVFLTIAKRELNDVRRWREIRDLNPGRFTKSGGLQPGTELLLPKEM